MTILIAVVAPYMANFYQDARLADITLILASTFFITAVGSQFRVLCQKEMKFLIIARITIASELVATLLAVWLAMNDYGVYALAYSSVAVASLNSISFLLTGLRMQHRPSFLFRYREIRGLIGFGLFQMGERTLNVISVNADKFLIGKLAGIDAVGLYSIASQLIVFPVSRINPIVNAVAFPAYAKIQSDFVALGRYYGTSVRLLSVVTVPLLVFLFWFADEAVALIFGSNWEKSADLVRILVLVGVGKALGNPGGALVLALGGARICFWWNAFSASITVACLLVSLLYWPSAKAAAYALLGLSVTVGLGWHVIIARVGRLDYLPIVLQFGRIIALSFLGGVIAKVGVDYLGLYGSLERIITGGCVCLLLYSVYLYVWERRLIRSLLK